MSFIDYVWIFILISALQPMLRQRLLEFQRALMIDRLERRRGSRVILLVHREETMRFLGFPLARYIDVHDSEEVLRAIQMTDPKMPLDIVLHTPGGLVFAALQIARAVKAHQGPVTVFVPHHAMSGGTLIALAAGRIVLAPHAVLGPVDPQIGQFPAASILTAVARKRPAEVDDETLILADVAGKAIGQMEHEAAALLSGRMAPAAAGRLARLLTSGQWTHDYPIPAAAAAELGLPVTTDMPEEIVKLMRLYPQPVRHQDGVEYLPVPHLPKPRPRR